MIISSPECVPLKKDPTWLLPNLDASYEEEEVEGDMNNNQVEKPRCSNNSNNNKHSRLPEEVCLSWFKLFMTVFKSVFPGIWIRVNGGGSKRSNMALDKKVENFLILKSGCDSPDSAGP